VAIGISVWVRLQFHLMTHKSHFMTYKFHLIVINNLGGRSGH